MRHHSRFSRQILLSLLTGVCTPLTCVAQWRVSVEPPSTGRPATVTATVRERADSLAAEEDATLFVIRCSAPQLDAFITTRDQFESSMTADVRVRVESDSARPRDARWQATKANTGAFVPTGELRDLIQQRLRRTETLRVTIPTQKRGQVTYTFPVAGIVTALEALRDACPRERNGALRDR